MELDPRREGIDELAILRVEESLRRLPTKTATFRTGDGGMDLFRRENWFATDE